MVTLVKRLSTNILCGFWDEVNNIIGIKNTPKDVNTLVDRAAGLVNYFAGFAGFVAGVFIIWGAYLTITAMGDKEKSESGQKTATAGLVGLVIIILGRVAVGFVFALVTKVW